MNAVASASCTAGARSPMADATATPSWAAASCSGGRLPVSSSASRSAYTLENTDPMTATPRVPPSSRVASLTAEPTPARAGGSTCRIDSVAGVLTRPRPTPMSTICGTITVA